MTKVFLRLVAEMKRLGATVVYASFNRMIIATDKTDVGSAKEYVRFVVDTLLAMPVFTVAVTPSTYWEQLLFMDSETTAASRRWRTRRRRRRGGPGGGGGGGDPQEGGCQGGGGGRGHRRY